jgi:hypothetical protein
MLQASGLLKRPLNNQNFSVAKTKHQSASNKSIAPLSHSTKAQKPKAQQQKLQPQRKSRAKFDRCIVTEEDYRRMTVLGHLVDWHGYLNED